jgi:hypothetical protein
MKMSIGLGIFLVRRAAHSAIAGAIAFCTVYGALLTVSGTGRPNNVTRIAFTLE